VRRPELADVAIARRTTGESAFYGRRADVRTRGHLADLPCVVDGCDRPRHVSPAGVKARCREHENARVRARYSARKGAPVRRYVFGAACA
jgi:hypothetical protein